MLNAQSVRRGSWLLAWLVGSALALALLAAPAHAQEAARKFEIPAGPLPQALLLFSQQANIDIVAPANLTRGKTAHAVHGMMTPTEALDRLLEGTGLKLDHGANGGLVLTSPAAAQAEEAPPLQTISEVIITGTNIRGDKPITPVETITSKEMIRSGYTRLDDALANVPSNFQGGVSEGSNPNTGYGENASYNSTFASGVNLRGLGGNSTLVLLNGHRLPDSAFGNYTDISKFPLSMIDRVEIVSDGATATYGADAVAGVVNIITQKSYSGVETGVKASSIARGKAPSSDAYVLAGTDWDDGNALVTYDHNAQYPLLSTKRPYTATDSNLNGPYALLPHTETNSIFGTISQSIGENVDTDADLFYSSRTFNAPFFAGVPSDNSGASNQYGIDLTGHVRLARRWSADIIGSLGEDRDHTDTSWSDQPSVISHVDYQTRSIEGRVNGSLFELPGGTVKVAAGALRRHESMSDAVDNLSARDVSNSRDVSSAYSELSVPLISTGNAIPLVKSLRFDVAARFDHYGDIGSAVDPKYGVEWIPVEDLTFHATYGKSFRAPTLYALGAGSQQFAIVYPSPDPAAPGSSPYVLYQTNAGSSTLRPETSTDIDLGLTIKPRVIPGLSLDVSYFDIDFTNKIAPLFNYFNEGSAFVDASELGSQLTLNPSIAQIDAALAPPAQVIYTNSSYQPIPPIPASQIKAIAYLGYANVASERPRGLDADLRYAIDSSYGQFSLSTAMQYFVSYETQVTPTSARAPGTGLVGFPDRFRANSQIGWSKDDWSAYGRVNYAAAYHDQYDLSCGGNPCPVSSWTTVDIGASLLIDRGPGPLRDIRISVDVVNLLDANPPRIGGMNLLTYDPTNANPLGRAFNVGLVKKW